MAREFRCTRCKAIKIEPEGSCGTGYALHGKARRKVCYACCAEIDMRQMDKTGRADLFLTVSQDFPNGKAYQVTNWPGTLRYPVGAYRYGHHNIARTRVDVWFNDHKGARWHGVQLGENNQIVRCKRVEG